jgi:hypothetical protein
MTGSELVSATITTIAGITFALHKLGVVKFDKDEKKSLEPCPLHNKMTDLVDTMKTQQSLNCQRHEQHEKDLKAGKDEFHELREEISSLRIGVGVLLDRTGGRPDDFRRKK